MNSGKICVSVAAETADELIRQIERATEIADIIEVRFDSLAKAEFDVAGMQKAAEVRARIVRSTERPLISTFRPKEQGGFRELSLAERETFWSSHPESAYCDVEEDILGRSLNCSERISSFHDFSGIPSDLGEIFDRLSRTGAKTIKVAATVSDAADAIPIWNLLTKARSAGKNTIPIAMCEAGKWTRILGLAHGAFLTYAALEETSQTADGQLTIDDALNVYRVKQLDRETKVFGVIGDPVSASLSPNIHNAAFVAAGLNAVFIPLQVRDIDAFVKRMMLPATREIELNFAGFAVTMPHKQAVIKYLDELEPSAAKIGAVNTIAIDDGKVTGHNTDAHGFVTPLKAKLGELKGLRVAVLGAGGAARACVDSLKQEGADVTVFARSKARADAFATEFDVAAGEFSNLRSRISDFDVLFNATPLGMKGDFETASPLTADELKGVKLVFDLVTRPNDTPLIGEARKAGVETISGIEMLIEQATKQFEIWTGREAPRDVMRSAALARMENTK